jgi:hypothetical protein
MKPHILAKVRFNTTAEGGRKTGVGGTTTVVDYYGCPFIVDGEAFDCRLLLEQPLELGRSYDVPVRFLNPQLVLPKLSEGKEFTLLEGKEIAKGKVLRMF